MREPIGKMSDRHTTSADRQKFRDGIGFVIAGFGGREIEEDYYRTVYQLDSAAGIITINVPYESNDSWLGSVFCQFQYRHLAEEIGGPISETGWKNYHFTADDTVEVAIQSFTNGIRPYVTTAPA